MPRVRANIFALLALSAVALGAIVAGCSTSNTPNPTITAPPLASSSFTPPPTPTPTVTPTKGPTPTPTPTPTGTAAGYFLQFTPASVTLTSAYKSASPTVDQCGPGSSGSGTQCSPDSVTSLSSNSCGSGSNLIATIDGSFSEYGIWGVTAGPKNGTCSFTVVDNSNVSSPYHGLTASVQVTNNSNAAKPHKHAH